MIGDEAICTSPIASGEEAVSTPEAGDGMTSLNGLSIGISC